MSAGSPAAQAWRRFGRDPSRLAALAAVVALALVALAGPLLTPFGYAEMRKGDVWAAPLTYGHLLGADALGRDLFARLLAGLQISLLVGATASTVALAIGVAWGVTAALAGGVVDELMMRTVDVLYALPFIFVVILLTVAFGKSLLLIFLAIGAVEWLTLARIVRGQALSLRRREFVEAARAIGVSPSAIALRHVAPNLLGLVIAYLALTVPGVILAESFLSFLGLGVQEPLTSLGVLVADGAQQMDVAPWLLVFPAIVMSGLLFALSVLGEGLREALDAGAAPR